MKRNAVRVLVAAGAVVILAAAAGAQTPVPPAGAPVPWVIQAEQLLDANQPKEAADAARKALDENAENPHAWFILARACHAAGDLDGAINAGHRAATFASVRASAFYNLACAYALKGSKEDAFKALTGAKRAGFADRALMMTDPDLTPLREDSRFVLPLERNYFMLKIDDKVELPFSVDLPVNFDPSRAYPVLIAPGHGRKVEGNWGGLFWGEDTSQRGWITVESPSFLLTDPVAVTLKLLDEVARRYKVEGGKFHLACYGPSSGPAFAIAMAAPERFKSLVALPGFPVTDDDKELARLKGIRVSFIVGANDAIWLNESQRAYARLQKLGIDGYLEIVVGANHLLQEMFGGELAERLELMR